MRKIKNTWLFIFLLLTVSFGYSINNVVLKPFPFFHVEYSSKKEWDRLTTNVDSNYFKREVFVPTYLKNALDLVKKKSEEEKIIWATKITREIQRNSFGTEIRDSKTILQNNINLHSVCSESSKIFTTLMNLLDIPSRVIWMNGHTVSEVYVNERWVLMDTYGNITAVNKEGNGVGIGDVIMNFKSVQFKQIIDDKVLKNKFGAYHPPNFLDARVADRYSEYIKQVFEHQNLVLAIHSKHLFSFHRKTKEPLTILKSILGVDKDAVGQAEQLIIDKYYVGNFGFRI